MYRLSFYVRLLKFLRKDPLVYCLSFYVRILKFSHKDVSASECVLERGWPLWCCCFEIVCLFFCFCRRRLGASGVLLKFLRKHP